MIIFGTENAPGFSIMQDGEVISLSNRSGYIEIDKDQLLVLLAVTRKWAEKGEPIE